ncbi:MAG TPA: 16S rRNA (guanine(966)-N(2))-methyltransferase RsmD [Burkholderiaceae bacterium]|nr:16S rRNA (guanine(966)-N(2))-methyltransferase RsmD [Burkholderiaceae bacterium]
MKRSASRAARGAREPPQQVRIVGGSLKRSMLPVLDRPGLRPTPQRVRETLFNWLGQELSGWACLDAFAGTGALGFEAASRGAASVVLLERDPDLVAALRAAQARLQVQTATVERAESLSWMRSAAGPRFHLVLLDPPFDDPTTLDLALQAATHLVVAGGFIYAEAARVLPDCPDGFERWRQARAGAVHFHLLRRKGTG